MSNFASFSTGGISAFVNGKMYVASPESHPNFEDIKAACRSEAWDALEEMFNVGKAIENWDDEMEIHGGHVYFRGVPLTDGVSEKILRMIDAGQPADSLKNFLVRVHRNPSLDARRELLLFCDANRFLIHEDGSIVGFKAIRHDWTDKYSGTIDNSIGATVKMDRGLVDDNRDRTCSRGLHFAALEYAQGFGYGFGRDGGDRLILMKICPSKVVSIPSDYNNQKGRCCEYTVLAEVTPEVAAHYAHEREVIFEADWVDDWDTPPEDTNDYCDNCGCEDSPDNPVLDGTCDKCWCW